MSAASARTPYVKLPEEVWRIIRRRWEEGESFASLARAFRVGESTVRNRRVAEGWVRRAEPAAPRGCDALSIAETALARSMEALVMGRAAEAQALIKAGDAVGAFADFVTRLRADAAARREQDVRAPAPSGEPADAAPGPA